MIYIALLQTAFARLMRNVPGYVAPSYEWVRPNAVRVRHGSWHNTAFELSFTLILASLLSFSVGGWSHPGRGALILAYLIGVLVVLRAVLVVALSKLRKKLVHRHGTRVGLHGIDWDLVNEAIVVWCGYGEIATPSRDELRLRRLLGRRCTPRVIATLWKVEDEFYQQASATSIDDARRALEKAHREVTTQTLDALEWCYREDWSKADPAATK